MSDIKQRIARIRATVDLPSLFLQYGVNLKQRGEEYSACCPFHDDSNPSLSIFDADDHKRYFCHACGASGDVVDAYMHFSGQDTMPALDDLDGGDLKNPKPFATISSEPKPVKPERTVTVPPPDAGEPSWDRAVYRCGDEWLSLGQPVATWCYRTADGEPWYYEARYEVTDENGEIHKEPRCWTWGNRGAMPARWECAHHPVPRPLFGLEQLADSDQVLIGEGPKKAAAARQMLNGTKSVACVGWAGGANGVRKSDWSALEGKALLLMPDADDPGRAAMNLIATMMRDKVPSIHIIDTSDMPHAWDAADALADGMTKAEFIAFLKERKREWVAPEPEPEPDQETESSEPPSIPPEPPPTEDYKFMGHDGAIEFGEPVNLFGKFATPRLNIDVLPKTIREFVTDRTNAINTDPAFIALSCITMAAGVIDDRIKISITREWSESARIWAMIVGEVSSKKSPAMNAAKHAIDVLVEKVAPMDNEIVRKAAIAQKRYEAKMKEYETEAIKDENYSGPMPPVPPAIERMKPMLKSMTLEGLEEVLRYQPRSVYCHYDELAGWLGSLDAYRASGVSKDRPAWLELFNGGTMQKELVGRGSFTIRNWSATMLGSIQPSKIGKLQEGMSDDGLLQRFLIVSSDYVAGEGDDTVTEKNHSVDAWVKLIDQLYFTAPDGGYVHMSPEAREIRAEAVKRVYAIIQSGYCPGPFQGFLGKLEGYSARLMLVWHCIECAESEVHPASRKISGETAQQAIDYLMLHLLPHAATFYEDGIAKSDIADCVRLIAGLIVANDVKNLSTTWLQKYGPPQFRFDKSPQHAFRRQVLARLIDLDWIKPSSMPSNVSRLPTQYAVNPAVHTMFSEHKERELQQAETRREIAATIRAGSKE